MFDARCPLDDVACMTALARTADPRRADGRVEIDIAAAVACAAGLAAAAADD